MKTDYNQTSMLDMVFEHRNKSYGAYVLRRDYDKSLKTAMAFTFSVVFLLITGNFIAERMKSPPKDYLLRDAFFTFEQIKLADKPPVIEQKKPEQKAQPKPKPTIQNTTMNVVANKEAAKDSIPTVEDLKNVESGLTDNRTAINDGLGVDGGKGTASSLEVAAEPAPVSNEAIWLPEIMPEFPGGEKKLLKFLADNTEYPDMERVNGIGGKVLAEVIIGLDGRITDVHIVKSPSPALSREVTRVAKIIPAFKPGMQQGRPVRVRMMIPFVFKVAEN